jgi:hypothetical protein
VFKEQVSTSNLILSFSQVVFQIFNQVIHLFQEINVSPESLKYIWYPELEIYGLERFGRQRVLKEMSGRNLMKYFILCRSSSGKIS